MVGFYARYVGGAGCVGGGGLVVHLAGEGKGPLLFRVFNGVLKIGGVAFEKRSGIVLRSNRT